MGVDGGITARGYDPFVGGQQIVRIGVKVGDPADHRSACDEVVTIGQQAGHQADITCVTLDERVVRMTVVGLRGPAVLREIVDSGHCVPALEQFLDDIAADEPG